MLKMFIRPVGLFCLHRVNSCSDVTEVMLDFILLRSFFKVVWWLLISSAHFTNSTLKSWHRVQTGPNKSFSHSVVYIFLNLVHAVNKLTVQKPLKIKGRVQWSSKHQRMLSKGSERLNHATPGHTGIPHETRTESHTSHFKIKEEDAPKKKGWCLLDDLSPSSVCSNTFSVPTCWKVSVEAWKPALSWSRLANICENEYSTMETCNIGCFLKGWCHLRAKSKWWRTDDNRFSASSLLILWLPASLTQTHPDT